MTKYMMLDESLPVRHSVPLHPETGQPWKERYDEIVEVSIEMAQGNPHAAAKRAELIAVTTFREEPFMVELIPQLRPTGDDSRVFSCHPKTWEDMPQCVKDKFTLVNSIKETLPPDLILPDRMQKNPGKVLGLDGKPHRPDLN